MRPYLTKYSTPDQIVTSTASHMVAGATGIDLYLMTSFHTHGAISEFLEQHDYFGHRDRVALFQQFRLPRIRPDGEVRQIDGEIDYATSGHGDFVPALQQSGLLARFLKRGGRWLVVNHDAAEVRQACETLRERLAGCEVSAVKESFAEWVEAGFPGLRVSPEAAEEHRAR